MLDKITKRFRQDPQEAISSIIGMEMSVDGDISFKGKMKIDGKILGNIRGEHLILSNTGMITGDVYTDTFICQGQVDGNVKVKKLNVKKEGGINGKVEAVELSVEFGASLNGEIKARTQDLRLVQGASQQPDQEFKDASSG
ncbi:MAG: polymer-forming cytoskeletal protein [Desulfobulbaceae bacterium]|nr:polymer-forming cytoskeletal protein [Desulfobulbaceae bacterium]MCK5543954.1 polymer-forming cytoskeletal protein [Desulfobulbaceae bacterium]